MVVLGLAWGCQSPGATTAAQTLPVLEQVGVYTKPFNTDRFKASSIAEHFQGVGDFLDEMKLQPTLVRSSKNERMWAVDLADGIRESKEQG
ncbi:MAG: hypothetical protein K8E66_08035, partial [Phycisphaerales bacterium]|nr:hypothetical protein [Phycisphaerales bacterium]